MPPDGYNTITVSDDVFALLTVVMDEYDCESIADAVETPSVIAPDYSEAEWHSFSRIGSESNEITVKQL